MIQPHEDRILYLPSHVPQVSLSFHLDENISHAVAGRLRDNGFDVTTTDEAGLRSTSDRTQMDFALRQQRVIVTRDQDFVQLHHDQYPHSGIVYWPHGRVTSSPQMLEMLVRLLKQICRAPESELAVVAAHPRWLPLGMVQHVHVQSVDDSGARVLLDSGYVGLIEPQHLPRAGLRVNDQVEAVVVRYVRSRKKLYLSMRRNFTFARTAARPFSSRPAQGRSSPAASNPG